MDESRRLGELERKLQYVIDRQEILDCICSTSRGNDRFDEDLIAGSYHDGSLHELGDMQVSGREYASHANAAHAAICETNLHNITMQTCEIDGDVAHAESYVIALFVDGGVRKSRMLAGRYIDRLEKRDGRWGIVLRRATLEVALEGQATLPDGGTIPGSGYLKGDRARTDPSYARPLTLDGGARW